MPGDLDVWTQAGFKPVSAPPAHPSPVARIKAAEATNEALRTPQIQAQTANTGMSTARTAAEMPKVQVESAVAQATKDAQIRKEVAQANDAEYTAKINELKSRYPQLSGEQTLAAARYELMQEGEKSYDAARGYDPGSLRNLFAGALSHVPLAGETMATFARDPVSRQAAAGQRQFTEGAVRSLTGAGLRGDERTYASSEFFPTAGEGADIAKQKAGLRQKYMAQLRSAAGPALNVSPTDGKTLSLPLPPQVAAKIMEGHTATIQTPQGQTQVWRRQNGQLVRVQ